MLAYSNKEIIRNFQSIRSNFCLRELKSSNIMHNSGDNLKYSAYFLFCSKRVLLFKKIITINEPPNFEFQISEKVTKAVSARNNTGKI